MVAQVSIGEFSKMTYLSVKALRHYHDVGLLEPAAVDPSSGYRRYGVDQVSTAQAIRRLRDLDMPLEQVRIVVQAPDPATRNQAILDHLTSMQRQLDRTQHAVASLQALLSSPAAPHPVEYRTLPAITVLAIEEVIAFDDGEWITTAFAELHDELARGGVAAIGPDGALYGEAFFTDGAGEVVAFVPIDAGPTIEGGRIRTLDLPASRVAVMLHVGPFDDLDQTYGALGAVVADLGLGAPGPIRELYLAEGRAEVCWPTRDP